MAMRTPSASPEGNQAAGTPGVPALVQRALTAADDASRWDAVRALHDLGTRDVLDAALALLASAAPQERGLGADILGQGQTALKTFHEESVAGLLRLLEREREETVLEAVCAALGHRRDPRAVPPLARLRGHPASPVRFAVASALGGFDAATAIQALIDLSADSDPDVRDWVTFGLGSQTDVDTPAVREALARRLADEDADTKGEAMVGLARRKDARVVGPLLADLAAPHYGTLVLEAARELGDPQLHTPLVRLRGRHDIDARLLEEAIAACAPRG
jgi:HEAT repeat protein